MQNTLVESTDAKVGERHSSISAMSGATTSPSLSPLSRRDMHTSMTDTMVEEQSTDTSPSLGSNKRWEQINDRLSVTRSNFSPCDNEILATPKRRHAGSRRSSISDSPKSATSSPTSTAYETPPTISADVELAVDQHKVPLSLQKARTIPALRLPRPAVATMDWSPALQLPSASTIHSQIHQHRQMPFVVDEIDLLGSHEPGTKVSTANQYEVFQHAVFENALTLCKGYVISRDISEAHT